MEPVVSLVWPLSLTVRLAFIAFISSAVVYVSISFSFGGMHGPHFVYPLIWELVDRWIVSTFCPF